MAAVLVAYEIIQRIASKLRVVISAAKDIGMKAIDVGKTVAIDDGKKNS